MKKHILFVNTISKIGGAELYILRKVKYLENNGFNVYIVSGGAKNIEFNEFYKHKFLEIKKIVLSPNFFCKNEVDGILKKILAFIRYQEQDEIFIESHQIYPAMWAEIFAQKVKRVNLVYCIGPFEITDSTRAEFYHKKLINDELLGCNESYIPETFGSKFRNNYFNIPFDPSEIEKTNNSINSQECDGTFNTVGKDNTVSILTISRIEKTYITQSIIDISDFCKKNPNIKVKYNLVLSKNSGPEYEKLKTIIEEVKPSNLNITLSGPVTKLTDTVFKGYDLFIGMGTSILNAVSMGIPSIVVDYRNNKYYGFFGYDYYEFGSGIKVADKGLDYFITKVLNREIDLEDTKRKAMKYFLDNYENEKVNDKFLEYQYEINKKINKEYFKFKKQFGDYKYVIKFILIHTVGIRGAGKIIAWLATIKRFLLGEKNELSSEKNSFR